MNKICIVLLFTAWELFKLIQTIININLMIRTDMQKVETIPLSDYWAKISLQNNEQISINFCIGRVCIV
jgi:hypothetical protein